MTVYGYCKSDPDIPIGELDYGFIEKCEDVTKLSKILAILRSGEEGRYPDLEQFAEKQLAMKNPDSPLLEKFDREKKLSDLPKNDVEKTIEEIKGFTSKVSSATNGNGSVNGDSSHLPPVRGTNGTTRHEPSPESASQCHPTSNPLPKGPEHWDKVDKQLENDENIENICREKSNSTHVNEDILSKPAHELLDKQNSNRNTTNNNNNNNNIGTEDATLSAQNEKNKGNEAFRCGDFKEALIYYNRSLDILPTPATYNNKAITLIKLEKFSEGRDAAEKVIALEPDNIKAHMRRGLSNQSLDNLEEAKNDFTKVTELEPSNKRGKELLQKVTKELDKQNANRKKKGHRVKIEDVEAPKIEEITAEEEEMLNKMKKKPTMEEVTIEDETPTTSYKPKKEPARDKGYMDGMYDPKVAEFLAGGSSLFGDNDDNNNTSLHGGGKSGGKELGDKLSSVLNFTQNFLKENEGSVDKEELGKFKSELAQLENLSKDDGSSAEEKTEKLQELMGEELDYRDVLAVAKKAALSKHHTNRKEGAEAVASAAEYSANLCDAKPAEKPAQPPPPKELPSRVVTMKNEANECYKVGQYDKASELYSKCIKELSTANHKQSFLQPLATFYSNRASCQTRMGNSKRCAADCDEAIKLSGGSAKMFLKRAEAYESLEKYGNAYVDYQNAHTMDSSLTKALQSCSRVGKMLQDEHGRSWREKLPKSDPVASKMPPPSSAPVAKTDTEQQAMESISKGFKVPLDQSFKVSHYEEPKKTEKVSPMPAAKPSPVEEKPAEKPKPSPPTPVPATKDQTSEAKPTLKRDPEKKVNEEQKEKRQEKETKILSFFDLKEEGNKCVQKGKYKEAIKSYDQCVELMPKEIPSYTNRALCFLKLKEPEKAIADCTTALKINKNHVKALFRRAQGQKMLNKYKESLADLALVLKLEPSNNAAKKEMEECKNEFTAQLRSIQAENEAQKQKTDGKSKTNGGGKKVVIEEITSDSTTTDLNGKTKLSTKTNKCPLSKDQKGVKDAKKMTGFEFLHAWSNVKSQKTSEYAELLAQIDPTKLVDLLSNKLDGEILKNFIHTINEHFTGRETFKRGIQLLKSLCKASRFVTMLMFLNTTEKSVLRSTVEALEVRAKQSSEKHLLNDVTSLRVSYQCS